MNPISLALENGISTVLGGLWNVLAGLWILLTQWTFGFQAILTGLIVAGLYCAHWAWRAFFSHANNRPESWPKERWSSYFVFFFALGTGLGGYVQYGLNEMDACAQSPRQGSCARKHVAWKAGFLDQMDLNQDIIYYASTIPAARSMDWLKAACAEMRQSYQILSQQNMAPNATPELRNAFSMCQANGL